MLVKNSSKDTTLIHQGEIANTFIRRLKGLLGRSHLPKGRGLILQSVKSIHTLGMAFAIDVVYLNKDLEVIKLDLNMVPYRLGAYMPQAAYILEMPVGTIQASQTAIGDKFLFVSKTTISY